MARRYWRKLLKLQEWNGITAEPTQRFMMPNRQQSCFVKSSISGNVLARLIYLNQPHKTIKLTGKQRQFVFVIRRCYTCPL